jgi:hypothetical protein
MEINADWDPSARFSEMHSWSWLRECGGATSTEVGAPGTEIRAAIPLVKRRVELAVDDVLGARGYTKVEPSRADFYLACHLSIDEEMDLRTTTTGYGYGPYGYRGGWADTETTLYKYDVGTLVLDVIDARDRKLVWRGSAKAQLQKGDDVAKRERRTTEAVTRILERFPPPAPGAS